MKQAIAIASCALFCFTSGLYLGVQKANDLVAELGEQYKETDNKVAVFTDLNDPKTIQSYVKQLRKLLDDITFLGKLIESGQIADEALTKMQRDIDAKLNRMVTIDEFASSVNLTSNRMAAIDVDLDDLFDTTEEIDDKLDRQYKAMIKSIDMIEDEVSEINKLLKTMNKKKFFHTHK
tara:strand:- start:105 stop:638 length:534 start_codon:yes stop_codon:yes gene_type:complete